MHTFAQCLQVWQRKISRGDPVDEVVRAAREWKVDIVYWNRDYEPMAIEPDRRVEQRLAHLGAAARTYKDHVVFEAAEGKGVNGEPLQRYSAYRDRWWSKWQTISFVALPVSTSRRSVPTTPCSSSCPLPTAVELGYDIRKRWIEPGERSARKRLQSFLEGPLHRYGDGQNLPGIDGSSKLSPHLRFGTLSTRAVVRAALASLARGSCVFRPDVDRRADLASILSIEVLASFPHVAGWPFRNVSIPPSRDPSPAHNALFQAWCSGRTSYPIVDAGMRQLNQTGWMHNRVCMIMASFLIKDLRIDRQRGEQYFMRHLLDADVAANNGN